MRFGDAIVFDRWEGGERGTIDPVIAASAEKQMWTGTNVVRYGTGLIGPRPGLKEITIASMPTGTVSGLDNAVNTSGTGPWFWVCIGGSFYRVDVGAGTVSSAYSGGSVSPTVPMSVGGYAGTTSYVAVKGVGVVQLNHVTAARAVVSGTPTDATVVGWYGRNTFRLCAGEDNVLYYSETFPGWATAWDALAFHNIGTALDITMIREFRDGLLIGKASGEMHLLTGVLDVDSTTTNIRRLSKGGGPQSEAWGIVLDGNQAWYIGYRKAFPSMFDGAAHLDFDWLEFTGGVAEPDNGVAPGFRFLPIPWMGADSFVLLSGQTGSGAANRMLERSGGTFTYHTFEQTMEAFGCCLSDPTADELGDSSRSLLLYGDDKYYHYSPGLDRPAFTSDTYAQPGDDSTTPFSTCEFEVEWFDPEGAQITVGEVQVYYRGWDTGSATANGFKVQVTALDRFAVDPNASAALDGSASTETTVVSLAGSNYGTAGKNGLATYRCGDQGAGAGFRVKVSDIAGCAIRRIVVWPAESPGARP